MGCDIHMYVQYREKERIGTDYDSFQSYGGRLNPGRYYGMFGILAGVRYDAKKGYRPKGLPEKLGYYAECDNYLYIRGDNEERYEGSCTLEQATRWGGKIIYTKEGKPFKTSHPDWHSHSWLTVEELKQAFKWYKKLAKELEEDESYYKVPLEYRALLATMKELEDGGKNEVIVVFWFDN